MATSEMAMMAMAQNQGGGGGGGEAPAQTPVMGKAVETKWIVTGVVAALVIGFLIWWFLQGQRICSKQSQCHNSSPSFDSVTGSSSKK